MYLGTYAYWLHRLAAAGIACNILSVDYPLAPGEDPFAQTKVNIFMFFK
jgi:acetyl esterase/lipase